MLRNMYSTKFCKSGYTVSASADGASALDDIRTAMPSVILLDILLPQLDGLAVLDQLKDDPKLKKIPVIMLSNLSDNVTVQKALYHGAENFIIKSDVTPQDVVKKVENILAGKETKQQLDPHVIELLKKEAQK